MKWTLVCLLGCLALSQAQRTDEEEEQIRCPRVPVCDTVCERQTNDKGCVVDCSCQEDPCVASPCAAGEMCQAFPCETHPCTMKSHKCIPMPPCAMPMCANACPHGYKKSEHGCDTCECKDLPEEPTLPKDTTMPKLCHFRKQFLDVLEKEIKNKMPHTPRDLKGRMGDVDCNEDGTFKPLQCNYEKSCWCVDDRGIEIEGTKMDRQTMEEQNKKPNCVPHVTRQVDISMVFKHEFTNIHEHMDGIKEAVGRHMSQWLEVRQEFIEIIKITPHREEINLVKIEIIVRHDGKSDLAYLTKKFQMTTIKVDHVIECHGKKMYLDPKSITLNHHVHPMEQGSSEDEDGQMFKYPTASRCGRIWREHRPVVIVAGFGIAVFLSVVIATVVMACKKRRSARAQFSHKKMDKFSENLAFQNDLYGHPDLAKDKDIVKTLSLTKTEDETQPQVLTDKY